MKTPSVRITHHRPKNKHFDDLTGRQFGRLKVVRFSHTVRLNGTRGANAYWLVQCACGVLKPVHRTHLVKGLTRSCGCLRNETSAKRCMTHGESDAGEYKLWRGMLGRCLNNKIKQFKDYGGRGIGVCDRWLNSYENFLSDMGRRPSSGHSLDRINNDSGYSPENCRWATKLQQARNTRRNRFLNHCGEVRTISEWAELTGLSSRLISDRLTLGWTINEALTTPVTPLKLCAKKRLERKAMANLA